MSVDAGEEAVQKLKLRRSRAEARRPVAWRFNGQLSDSKSSDVLSTHQGAIDNPEYFIVSREVSSSDAPATRYTG